MAPQISRQIKVCGHHCYPSNLKKCCSCEDLRPLADGYDSYKDGVGWTTTAQRDDGYCPVCNTKNYDKWMSRVKDQTEKKQREDQERQQLEKERRQLIEGDRLKNMDKSSGKVEYSNGDVYMGGLLDGQPHSHGKMEYALGNEDDVLYYEGEWVNGLHCGKGTKVFFDDMWYEGEWKNGLMHGKGMFHQDEATIMEGNFEEDVFQD